MKIENEKLYFWNVIEVTVHKSLDEEEDNKIFGIHVLSEEKVHGNHLRYILKNIINQMDYVDYYTSIPIRESSNREIEVISAVDFMSDVVSYSTKCKSASNPLPGTYLNEQKDLLECFEELKIFQKGKKKHYYLCEETFEEEDLVA